MGYDYIEHDYAIQENPDALVVVAADFIDTINSFWYDPYVLNVKSNTTDDDDDDDDEHHYVNVD